MRLQEYFYLILSLMTSIRKVREEIHIWYLYILVEWKMNFAT